MRGWIILDSYWYNKWHTHLVVVGAPLQPRKHRVVDLVAQVVFDHLARLGVQPLVTWDDNNTLFKLFQIFLKSFYSCLNADEATHIRLLIQGGCRLYKIKFKDNSRTFQGLRKKNQGLEKIIYSSLKSPTRSHWGASTLWYHTLWIETVHIPYKILLQIRSWSCPR